MIRKLILAASVLTLSSVAGLAQAQQDPQGRAITQVAPPSVDNGPALQRIGANLQTLMQQMSAYGMQQQKANPQLAAMTQALLVQADYMRNVAAILYSQSAANAKALASDKQKKQLAKNEAEKLTPLAAQQKKISDQAMKSQQLRFDDAVKQIEQKEKAKQSKDQSQILAFQTALLKFHGQLDRIMLDEMAD